MECYKIDISNCRSPRTITKGEWKEYLNTYTAVLSRNRLSKSIPSEPGKCREKVRVGFVLFDGPLPSVFYTVFAWFNLSHGKKIPRRKLIIERSSRIVYARGDWLYKEKMASHSDLNEAIDYIHHNPDPERFTLREFCWTVSPELIHQLLMNAFGALYLPSMLGPRKLDRVEINNKILIKDPGVVTLGPWLPIKDRPNEILISE